MATRKTMYLFDDVEKIINSYGTSFLEAATKPGKVKGKLSLAGVVRLLVTSFNRIMKETDHGLTAEEVAFIAKVHSPIQEDGDLPVNPMLWAMVFAWRGEPNQTIDHQALGRRLEALTPAQVAALNIDFIRLYSGLDLKELLAQEREERAKEAEAAKARARV